MTTQAIVNSWGSEILYLNIRRLEKRHMALPLIHLGSLCAWDSTADQESRLCMDSRRVDRQFPNHFLGYYLDDHRGFLIVKEFVDCRARELSWQSILWTVGEDSCLLMELIDKAWKQEEAEVKARHGAEHDSANQELIRKFDTWRKFLDHVESERSKAKHLTN